MLLNLPPEPKPVSGDGVRDGGCASPARAPEHDSFVPGAYHGSGRGGELDGTEAGIAADHHSEEIAASPSGTPVVNFTERHVHGAVAVKGARLTEADGAEPASVFRGGKGVTNNGKGAADLSGYDTGNDTEEWPSVDPPPDDLPAAEHTGGQTRRSVHQHRSTPQTHVDM